MVGTLLLTEARAGHADHTGLVQQVHAVHGIGSLAHLLGGGDGLGRHRQSEVGVQGTIDRQAGHALQLVQGGGQLLGAHLQGLQNAVLLLLEQLVGGVTRLGRVDHHVHGVLAVHVGAAADGQQLVQLGAHVIGEVHHLQVTAAATALAPVALGGGVEGHQLAVQLQLGHHLLEGHELVARAVDVLLVHLIGQDRDVLAGADLADVLDVLTGEALARGVAGVHGGDGLHRQTLRASALDALLDVSGVQSPVLLLLQVVGLVLAAEDVDGGRVQRVLGNGDQDAVRRLVDQQLQGILNGLGGTVGQEDVLGVAREAIALGDVGGHIVADLAHTGGVGVGTRATGVGNQQLLSSLDGIGVEHLGVLLSDLRPGGDAQHLSQEGNGLLLDGLGVADVAVQQRVEGELLALLQLLVDLHGANDDLTSHSVISGSDLLVDVVDGDAGREASQGGEGNVLGKTEHCQQFRLLQ